VEGEVDCEGYAVVQRWNQASAGLESGGAIEKVGRRTHAEDVLARDNRAAGATHDDVDISDTH